MEFEWLKNWNCFGIGEIKYLYLGWMVATQVTNIPFGLAFKENLKNRASYWRHDNTPLRDKMRYNSQ